MSDHIAGAICSFFLSFLTIVSLSCSFRALYES
ncbi:MAG: hypothetical protein RLZZ224_1256 [Verrucomicrobiota bacterium]|jgi:hypothetical protein